MDGYATPAAASPPADTNRAAGAMAYLAGLLGLLTFVWGFLTWFAEGTGRHKTNYGGYAAISGTGAAIGFGLAAGLVALALAVEKKPMTLMPTAMAATSLLLDLGLLIGKGNVKEGGESTAKVSTGIGLILALITAVVQVVVLGYAWLVATGRVTAPSAKPAPAVAPYPGAYQAPPGYQTPPPAQPYEQRYQPPAQAPAQPPPQPPPVPPQAPPQAPPGEASGPPGQYPPSQYPGYGAPQQPPGYPPPQPPPGYGPPPA